MDNNLSEVTIKYEDDSTLESPKWETSGLALGLQWVMGTAGVPVWGKEASTAAEILYERFVPIEFENVDVSLKLIEDEKFKKSIERGRDQIRKGGPYLNHEDVFGDV